MYCCYPQANSLALFVPVLSLPPTRNPLLFLPTQFRLRQCGIRHPIYLVEDSGSVQHLSLPEETLQQAITNTQVRRSQDCQAQYKRDGVVGA